MRALLGFKPQARVFEYAIVLRNDAGQTKVAYTGAERWADAELWAQLWARQLRIEGDQRNPFDRWWVTEVSATKEIAR